MAAIIIRFFIMVVGTLIIIYLAMTAFRRAKRLDQRIQESKEEIEEHQKKNGVINPYAALAELYAEQEAEEKNENENENAT